MSTKPLFLTEEEVQAALEWTPVFDGIKQMMSDVSAKSSTGESLVIQPSRGFMLVPHKNGALLTMPGFSERKKVFSCKLVTSFIDNKTKGLPSILANILIFDPDTGKLKAIIEGTTITEWRTAVASAVATSVLKPNAGKNQTLAVFGAGRQGRMHIIAFQQYFQFPRVKLWNRTHQKAVMLAEELKKDYNIDIKVVTSKEECARDADVLVTATYSSDPLVKFEQLKQNVMVNAVGAGIKHHCELDESVYKKSSIYTDSMENARIELKGLIDQGFPILGEVGEIINGQKQIVNNDVIIFHSLGLALEDGVTAKLVLDKYMKN